MQRYPTPNMNEFAGVLDRRLEALLIDGILIGFTAGILGYLAGILFIGGNYGGPGGAIITLQFGAPILFLSYQTAFEGYYGQTLGKSLRSIVVVNENGSDLSWNDAVTRNLLRLIDALPFFYVVGIIVADATDNNQRIGDLMGNTVVVQTEN